MRVQFEFTAADMADAAERAAAHSRTVREWRAQGRATWAALLSLALFFALQGRILTRAIYSLAIFIGLVLLYPHIFRSSPSAQYLNYYREKLGGDGPFICEVEITPEAVTTRQCGTEMKISWRNVTAVNDTPGGLELTWRSGGFAVIRDRAFQTPQQRSDFLELARSYSMSSNSPAQ
jgi:hypothetical protein